MAGLANSDRFETGYAIVLIAYCRDPAYEQGTAEGSAVLHPMGRNV
jgi:hypothetical protein